MEPDQARLGLKLLEQLPDENADLVEDPPYRDLTEFSVFRNR